MGRLIQETAQAAGDEIEAAFGREDLERLGKLGRAADVVIDFSRPDAFAEIASYVRRTGTPLLSGTTGFTPEQLRQLESLGSSAPVLWSANFSLGMAVLYRALREVSGVLKPDFDVEKPTTTRRLTRPAAPPSCCWRLWTPGGRPAWSADGRGASGGGGRTKSASTPSGAARWRESTPSTSSVPMRSWNLRQIFVNGALHMARLLPGKPNGVYDLQKILFGE